MSYQQFTVSDNNPNDTAGGGGCICSPDKQTDCKPPYVVFYGNDMESPVSPHVVACKSCIVKAAEALDGEIMSIGEKSPLLEVIDVAPEDVEVLDDEDVPAV